MEFSVEAVSKRMILVIIFLSGLIALGGLVFYGFPAGISEGIPFVISVALAMALNIVKVILLRRAVNAAVDMEVLAAKRHMQAQASLRMLLTLTVFVVVGLRHGRELNLFGLSIGIFSFPIAAHLLRFFLRDQEHKEMHKEISAKSTASNATSAIDKINALSADGTETEGNE